MKFLSYKRQINWLSPWINMTIGASYGISDVKEFLLITFNPAVIQEMDARTG